MWLKAWSAGLRLCYTVFLSRFSQIVRSNTETNESRGDNRLVRDSRVPPVVGELMIEGRCWIHLFPESKNSGFFHVKMTFDNGFDDKRSVVVYDGVTQARRRWAGRVWGPGSRRGLLPPPALFNRNPPSARRPGPRTRNATIRTSASLWKCAQMLRFWKSLKLPGRKTNHARIPEPANRPENRTKLSREEEGTDETVPASSGTIWFAYFSWYPSLLSVLPHSFKPTLRR